MLKIRYLFRLTQAFLARFKVIILVGIIIGLALFVLLRLFLPLFSNNEKIRIGMTGRFTTTTIPENILDLISQGLTQLDKNGNPLPSLATSWETTDKGKTWTFKLADNKFWQDGKPIVSSSISYLFSDVTIERPNSKNIVFKLQNPYAAFPVVVSKPVFKKGLLGSGKWSVKKLSLSGDTIDQITLESVEGKQIIYRFYPTEERTKIAYELGQVDEISNIFDPQPFDSWKRVSVTKNVNEGEYVAAFFNTQDSNLGDKSLRQALSYAINKDQFGEQRAISPISPLSWAYNSQVKAYNYDSKKASDLISDYKKSSKIDDLKIEISTSLILLSKAEQIKKDWEAVGVNADIKVVSGIPDNYQVFLTIFDIPDDPDQYSIWHSSQLSSKSNVSKFKNDRIDKLLEDGRTELDLETRRKIYLDFQRYLLEDAPAAFLYYPSTFDIKRG